MIDFKLDPKSGVPFYRQIIDQVRQAVASGELKLGEALPSVRQLAFEDQVSLLEGVIVGVPERKK